MGIALARRGCYGHGCSGPRRINLVDDIVTATQVFRVVADVVLGIGVSVGCVFSNLGVVFVRVIVR